MNTSFINSRILRLCKQPRTFEYISKHLDGLDPIQALSAIQQLENDEKLFLKDNMWVVSEIAFTPLKLNEIDPHLYLRKYMGYFDFLKTPHPLDFEWRNSTSSLNYLVSKILELNHVNDKVLVLGMPTLLATASEKDIPHNVTLVERNRPIVDGLHRIINDGKRFKVIDADIFKVDSKQIGKFYSVIMDPPWYSKHFYQFMWLASECVEIGGFVAISLPPINTRPNILTERLDWLSFCTNLGLCIESIYPQQLQYAMPFFEFNALRAAGAPSILPFWRKGDLAILRKIQAFDVERPHLEQENDNWIEKEINSVRIRVKVETQQVDDTKNDLLIDSFIKGDILPTVSTRDERRKTANVWTSGNRIFKTTNPKKLLYILDEIQSGNVNNNDKDFETVNTFVETITTIEKKEFDSYLHWLYYEMERQAD